MSPVVTGVAGVVVGAAATAAWLAAKKVDEPGAGGSRPARKE